MPSQRRGKLLAMLSFGKMKSLIAVFGLLLLVPACASKDGINSSTSLSTGAVPVAGAVYSATDAAAAEVGNSLVDVATGVIFAPFEVAESLLGIDQYGRPVYQAELHARTYDERLSLRRNSRGLPKPAATRVKERQAAMRVQLRRPVGY